jgi:surface antigen
MCKYGAYCKDIFPSNNKNFVVCKKWRDFTVSNYPKKGGAPKA